MRAPGHFDIHVADTCGFGHVTPCWPRSRMQMVLFFETVEHPELMFSTTARCCIQAKRLIRVLRAHQNIVAKRSAQRMRGSMYDWRKSFERHFKSGAPVGAEFSYPTNKRVAAVHSPLHIRTCMGVHHLIVALDNSDGSAVLC